MDAVIDQRAGMTRPFGVVLDGERLGLPAPEGMSGFGDRHAFTGAGIENTHRAVGRRQCGQCPL